MRKISLFDAQTVPLRNAQVAKKTLKPYDKDQIRDVSAGAATFYIWVSWFFVFFFFFVKPALIFLSHIVSPDMYLIEMVLNW